mmetsp:Transcript_13990/g.31107  ORF Transcript_13990/g.31107 Transcript_13990/m.31107 type:complete len:230 (-) Transcript_13990:1368-2057(-)
MTAAVGIAVLTPWVVIEAVTVAAILVRAMILGGMPNPCRLNSWTTSGRGHSSSRSSSSRSRMVVAAMRMRMYMRQAFPRQRPCLHPAVASVARWMLQLLAAFRSPPPPLAITLRRPRRLPCHRLPRLLQRLQPPPLQLHRLHPHPVFGNAPLAPSSIEIAPRARLAVGQRRLVVLVVVMRLHQCSPIRHHQFQLLSQLISRCSSSSSSSLGQCPNHPPTNHNHHHHHQQ